MKAHNQGKDENVASEMSPGQLLKRERESQGLSIEAIHDATNIPLDALRAIEEGYTIRILSPFYIKGFIKIYAQYLKVDVTSVIQDYQREKLPEHVDGKVKDFNWQDLQESIDKILTRKRKRQLLYAAAGILGAFLFFKLIVFIANRPKGPIKKIVKVEKKDDAKIQNVNPGITETKKTQPIESVNVSAPTVAAGVSTTIVSTRAVNLTVRAKKRSWLRVKADDQVVFQSTLREGAVETWLADNMIEISGNSLDVLEFELNGKMIGSLGRKDRKASKVIVTKDGLKVDK